MIIALNGSGWLMGVPEGAAEPDVRISVAEALTVLRARYEAGEDAAALEAVVLVGQSARLPLGGGYRHAWPALPPDWSDADASAAVSLWRGVRGAEKAADILRRASCAADISTGLRSLLASVLEAERGAALLEASRRG